jgi:hypothetical protein
MIIILTMIKTWMIWSSSKPAQQETQVTTLHQVAKPLGMLVKMEIQGDKLAQPSWSTPQGTSFNLWSTQLTRMSACSPTHTQEESPNWHNTCCWPRKPPLADIKPFQPPNPSVHRHKLQQGKNSKNSKNTTVPNHPVSIPTRTDSCWARNGVEPTHAARRSRTSTN